VTLENNQWLSERFEASRSRLEGVAYRMLGSRAEAEDAVQEAWLRLERADAGGDRANAINNLDAWLTTVVTRVCLDALRTRQTRGEAPIDDAVDRGPIVVHDDRFDPEREAVLADSVGIALLVVLERLKPAERVAFVLHDMFDFAFDDIAAILGRSPEATRQLASRARRRVRGEDSGSPPSDRSRQRQIARAYFDASRRGDLESLLSLLAPDVELHVDAAAVPPGVPAHVRGAEHVARRALSYRGAAQGVHLALVDGRPGFILAPLGRLSRAMAFTFANDRIVRMDVIADPQRLAALDIALLDG
jgi:RNA polymerase sigma factor (sigma-70 family)